MIHWPKSLHESFYHDPAFRAWQPLTVYLYRYLCENDHCDHLTGIGRVDQGVMLAETRLTAEDVARAKREMGETIRWFSDGTYWIVAWANHACRRVDGTLISTRMKLARQFVLTLPGEIRDAFASSYPDVMARPPSRLRKLGGSVVSDPVAPAVGAADSSSGPVSVPQSAAQTATAACSAAADSPSIANQEPQIAVAPRPRWVAHVMSMTSPNWDKYPECQAELPLYDAQTTVALVLAYQTQSPGVEYAPPALIAHLREKRPSSWQEKIDAGALLARWAGRRIRRGHKSLPNPRAA
jgi:hypothetical protein